ncbi:MAG: hypothetical protein ACRC9R_09285, partial [Enterovibrio sp.]
MTDRPTNNSSRPNTPPPVSGAATSSATTTTDTAQLPITAVTSQAQITPQTTSGAVTSTTSALPSTVVTSAIGAGAGQAGAQQHNYRLGADIDRFHTDQIRFLGGSNRCGEYSLLFLCRLFNIPEGQIPIPVRSPREEYNYLDLMTPLGTGRAEGAFGGDGLLDVDSQQIQCINDAPQALLNSLDTSRPYLVTTSAVAGGHTLVLFFDYGINRWSVYNSQSTPPVVPITDQAGRLNADGQRLMPLHAPQHRIDFCPMSPARLHFLMRYVYHLHMTDRVSVRD